MTILFYTPFNHRSRDVESVILAFHKNGHRVLSLNQTEGNGFHAHLQSQGIAAYSYLVQHSPTQVYFLKHILYLIQFCRLNNVDILYSHLEPANFVAVIAQYFIKAKVYITRHHVDEAALRGFSKTLTYKLTYKLARRIITVSERSVNYMVSVEKINPSKIKKINLAYDFSLYAKPNSNVVADLKKKKSAQLVLITACRFTKYKRADLSVRVLKNLIDAGLDAKLILLGRGEEEQNLRQLIMELKITDKIEMPGHVINIIDYLAASDFLIHPSVLESSCVVVKEAAITNVPVIVCRDVGDFDDYIKDGWNGFSVSKEEFVSEAARQIITVHQDKSLLKSVSQNLLQDVMELFDIEKVFPCYTHFLRS